MFKVVPDQLKISDGWVRCGHCADVFDATLYLEAWVPPPPVPAPPPPPPPEPEPTSVLVQEPEPVAEPTVWNAEPAAPWTPMAAGFSPPSEPIPAPVSTAEEWAAEAPLPPPAQFPDPEPALAAPAFEAEATAPFAQEPNGWLVSPENVSDAREHEQAAPAIWQPPVSSPVAEAFTRVETFAEAAYSPVTVLVSDPPPPSTAVADQASQPESDFHAELERFAAGSSGAVRPISAIAPLEPANPEPAFAEPGDGGMPHDDEPGFVRQAKQRAFWRSPGVRAALGVLAVFLAMLLAAQWALHERDPLAASHPDLAPLLTRLCEPLGCEVGPVRRIDAVVIDSSTLVRRLGNFYSFDLVLKNTATMPVAVPALELSLTDSRDSVITRRVFLPQEMPGAPRLVPAEGALSMSLRLSIADAGAVPMAGYRALVFYP